MPVRLSSVVHRRRRATIQRGRDDRITRECHLADDDPTGAWVHLLLVATIVIYTVISLLNTLVI